MNMEKDVPYIVYESEAARHERTVKEDSISVPGDTFPAHIAHFGDIARVLFYCHNYVIEMINDYVERGNDYVHRMESESCKPQGG